MEVKTSHLGASNDLHSKTSKLPILYVMKISLM